jgi:DNA-directed RNA polymerase specialized sigma24 family protein
MPTSTEEWHALDKKLLSYIMNYLYSYHVIHWKGSELELANDVLQETYLRVLRFTCSDKAHEGVSSIQNFEALCKIVAKHYILDLYRKDKRFVGSLDDENFSLSHIVISILDDPSELALADMQLYSIMLTISRIVKRFPKKQRTAILIDLAHKTDFDEEAPAPLERAMEAVGITLRNYNQPLPYDTVHRNRHNSLVCHAYKRLRLTLQKTLSQLSSAA